MRRITYKNFTAIYSANKPLIFAVIISIILHIILLGNLLLSLPKARNEKLTLNVSLAKLPSANKTLTETAKQLAEPNITTTPVNLPDLPLQASAETASTDEPATEPVIENSAAEANLSSEPEHPEIPSQNVADTSTNSLIANPYRLVETEFEIVHSTNPLFNITHTIKFNTLIESTTPNTTATPLPVQPNEGVVSQQDLKSIDYTQQGASNQASIIAARTPWLDGSAQIGDSAQVNSKYLPLPREIQDELNYLYHTMFYPQSAKPEINMTNRPQLSALKFSGLKDVLIQTKFGELKTLYLVKNGEEKIDLWLAVDYQFTPVKLRKTAKDGSYIEQTATKLTSTAPNNDEIK